jgi:hypothetical protein
LNITSYNVTDVGYHYIGLRALSGLPSTTSREDQTNAISRSIVKYVRDKALRLMLPEPRGTFETIGEKVCQELVHFRFVKSGRTAYELTEAGTAILVLLEARKYRELRRAMVSAHLETYENLRVVVQKHLANGAIWRPIVDAGKIGRPDYVQSLLEPTFKEASSQEASKILATVDIVAPKTLEDALQQRILQALVPEARLRVPLFRSMCDRLVSLRLLNTMRATVADCEFLKSYSPCKIDSPPRSWYSKLTVPIADGHPFSIYLCEPDVEDAEMRNELVGSIFESFSVLSARAGYFDLPEVRDFVCERLSIPEASFDEGLNRILDLQPSAVTMGLQYEGISGRRVPFVRDRGAIQIYNLIRRA